MTIRFSRDLEPDVPEQPLPAADLHRESRVEPAPVLSYADPSSEGISADAVFVPEYYEENYAYPLIIWVQQRTRPEHGLGQIMPEISNRNYFGMSLEFDPLPDGDGQEDAALLPEHLLGIEEQLRTQTRNLRRQFHIHTERIYLAGFGRAATSALQLGLAHPEWFAGMACISGRFPHSARPLQRFRALKGKRVLLAVGTGSGPATIAETYRTGRLLHAAGMRVCTRIHETEQQIPRSMLTDIDRWIMHEIYSPQPVS